MNVKKTVKKIVALGTGAAMLGMTLMGALAVAPNLSGYPGFLIHGGQFDGKIVVGAHAQPQDIIGAIDIAAAMQAASTTKVAVSQGSTSTVLSGDVKQIENSGNSLEVGEQIGSVVNTLTDSDMQMLASGHITTQAGTTDYTQVLKLNPTDIGSSNSGFVMLDKNNQNVVSNYLFFKQNQPMFEYQVQFTSDLQAAMPSSGTELTDMEDKTIPMMGKQYSIVKADVTTGTPNALSLTLIAGDVTDTLQVGQTKTYTVNGTDYEVTVLVVGTSGSSSTPSVKFLVNGQVTDTMNAGDTFQLTGGMEIGVRDIVETTQYLQSQPSSIVEFYLGANKLELSGNDDGTNGLVKVNGQSLGSKATLALTGSVSGGNYHLSDIDYTISADAAPGLGSNLFVAPGHGMREYMRNPDVLLNPNFDISFQGMTTEPTSDISFSGSSDTYDFTFTNSRGETYSSLPFLYAYDSSAGANAGKWKLGDETSNLVINNTYSLNGLVNASIDLNNNDYFVVTHGSDDSAVTYVLQFNDVNTVDQTVSVQDVSSGELVSAKYGTGDGSSANPYTGTLRVGGYDFNFKLYNGTSSGDYNLNVDLNGDTSASDGVVPIVTKNGGILQFNSDGNQGLGTTGFLSNYNVSGGDTFKFTLTTLGKKMDTNSNVTTTWTFTQRADTASNLVDLTGNTASSETASQDYYAAKIQGADEYKALDRYGTAYDWTTSSTSANSLTIAYPAQQRIAQVYVVGGSTSSSTATSGGQTSTQVNVLPTGLAVLDSEVNVDDANLIVVGGPCANHIAAELLGNPTDCTEGFQDGMGMIRTFDTGNNVAILVAGSTAQDTVQTSDVLAKAATTPNPNLVGDNVEVVIAGANDVTVRAAMPAATTTTTGNSTNSTNP
jgi:hypothetical protein